MMGLEGRQSGYSRGELRRLDRQIIPAIEEAIGEEYALAIDTAIKRGQRELTEASPDQFAMQGAILRRDEEIEGINRALGKEPATIMLEDADYELVRASLPQDGLLGSREARKLSLAIEDAVESAKTMANA
mgnify:CR=1 FL=1